MKSIKAILVVVLAVIAVIIFPLGMISFIAAESTLTHITLIDGGEAHEFLVGADTVGGFFSEAGIEHTRFDRVSHADDAMLWDDMTITIEREVSFYVQTDGGEIISRTSWPGITASEVMRQLQQENEVALVYHGDEFSPVQDGEVLTFETWRQRFLVELFPIPYETHHNRTNAVSQGQERLRIEGEYGELAITTSIVYVGGIESSREVVSEEVITEPIDAIIDIGTGWLGSLTDVNSPYFHYYRRVRMEATAYTAGYGCTGKHPCDPWYGITASGRRVQHGIVAVDRNVIPLGTRLYVENHGFSIAADVGGAIRGYKIDLFMYELEDALRFGRRHIYVWILDEI